MIDPGKNRWPILKLFVLAAIVLATGLGALAGLRYLSETGKKVQVITARGSPTPPPDPSQDEKLRLTLDRDEALSGEIVIMNITGEDASRIATECYALLEQWTGDSWRTSFVMFGARNDDEQPMTRPSAEVKTVPTIGCLPNSPWLRVQVLADEPGLYHIRLEGHYERDFETQRKALWERSPPPPLVELTLYARLRVTG